MGSSEQTVNFFLFWSLKELEFFSAQTHILNTLVVVFPGPHVLGRDGVTDIFQERICNCERVWFM